MKLQWIEATRWPKWPWWAVALPVLWAMIGGAALWVSAHSGYPMQPCLLKHLTGCPCPTCGFTRGTLAFLHGHPIQAWLYNPLLFSFLGVAGLILLARLATGRTPVARLDRRQSAAVWVVAVLLFAANWLYVIRYVG